MVKTTLNHFSSSSSIPDSEPERVLIRSNLSGPSRLPMDVEVIEIMNTDSEPETPAAPTRPNSLPSSPPPVDKAETGSAKLHSDSTDSDRDESPPPPRPLQLAQFAFVSNAPSRASSSRLTSTPSVDALPVPDALAKKPGPSRLKKSHSALSPDFTDKDIEKVLACIGCDARWTVRKSAAQKTQHMRSCCKKNGYTQETINVLLRKALEGAPAAVRRTKKGPTKEDQPPASPTLLAELNPPETKKKRGRVASAKTTVASLVETREDILNRAQAFLHSDSEPHETLPATQAFGSSRLGGVKPSSFLFEDNEPPPPTQRFGTSKLAAAKRSGTSLFDYDDAPPATQAFTASKLGGVKSTGASRYAPKTGSTEADVSSLSSGLAAMSLKGKAPRAAKSASPTKSKTPRLKTVYDEAWEDRLRKRIRADKELCLRILRFEPIHIEVFYPLSSESGASPKPDNKLKRHLSAFLDKEGINFYTSDKWGKAQG